MLSLGGAVNSGADWVCGLPIVRGIISNSIFTALLITALAAIVALGVYRAQLAGAGGRKAVRAFLYLFFLVSAVMFVHQYTLSRTARAAAESQSIRDVFTGIQQSRATGGDARWAPARDEDCGCPDAPLATSLARQAAVPLARPPAASLSARPNNVAGPSLLDIQDVSLPETIGPF